MDKVKQMRKIQYRFSLENSRANSPVMEYRKSQNKMNMIKQTLRPLRTIQKHQKINPFLPKTTKLHPSSPSKPKHPILELSSNPIQQRARNNTEQSPPQKTLKARNNRIRIHTEQKSKPMRGGNTVHLYRKETLKERAKEERDLCTREETQGSPIVQLTAYEEKEARIYEIFFVGERRVEKDEDFTDEDGDPVVEVGDSIMFRYEVLGLLGSGAFGKVYKVYDHRRNQICALKIIKNHPKYQKQAKVQIKILQQAILFDPCSRSNIVQLKHAFLFRGHPCLTFQLLHINLFQFSQQLNFVGLSLALVHKLAVQVLQCLAFLEKNKIIHCDLKPENIMIRRENKTGVKVVDFGSGCFEGEQVYNYIQSRYYRAPQIALGVKYGMPIDMWSFGCVVVELFTGQPLFPGESEADQLSLFTQALGLPPRQLIDRGGRSHHFFNQNHQLKATQGVKLRIPQSKPLEKMLRRSPDPLFIDFVKKIIIWVPEQRMKASQALSHPWILEGIPEQLRAEHLKLTQS